MRPVLLGMCNPLSGDPEHALYPHPEGCTGHRVYAMLREVSPDVTRQSYLRGFDRRNLVAVRAWSMTAGRTFAAALKASLEPACEVAVLGAATWSALRLPRTEWLGRYDDYEYCVTWYRVPHPSGLNRWYNDAGNRLAAARLLLRVMESGS